MQQENPTDAGASASESSNHIPGEVGIWVVIFGDMLVFGLMFLTFMFYRRENLPLFLDSQLHLNQTFGLVNTLLMLSSSWFVALSVQAARRNQGRLACGGFCLAILCGLGFSVVKVLEYRQKVAAGILIDTNDFFTFYYVLTGIHFLHVCIGMVVLGFMARSSWYGAFSPKKIGHFESGASFWHLVDLLWIALFALLYLLR
jgi:nitric oxide reductase NorE protein